MKHLHMTVSPKGGIGKSFVAALLTQWLRDRGASTLVAYDNDPANATLKAYEALEVRKQELKDAATRAQQDANGLCSDCPEKAAPTHHHSVSEERKVDCIHCIEQAIYA